MEQVLKLLEVMGRLRDPDSGCQWDLKQTFATIAPYTIEEAYEVADAIERGDIDSLRDELGDLLLQVVFHSQIAKDEGMFDFAAVAQGITDKMIRRHPHVFGDVVFSAEEDQKAHWEQLKQEERASKAVAGELDASESSALDDVALALPALMRAEKIQKSAARVGFDWNKIDGAIDKIDEELTELRDAICKTGSNRDGAIEDELGDLLFAVTNVARHLKIDPEQSLKKATAKFERRFRHVEHSVKSHGRQISALETEVLDTYWSKAKDSV